MEPPAPSPDYSVTHPLRPIISASILTLLLFALSTAIAYMALRPSPPPMTMALLAFALLFMVAWGTATLIMWWRRPSAAERVRFWSRVALAIIFTSHLACLALIWGLMPWAPLDSQLLIAIPLICCIPTQIICSPESTLANRSGIIVVLGSLALLLATRDAMLARLAAAYVAGFAIVMFVLSNAVNRTVQATVSARLKSDAAARELDRLLGEVAASRDAKTKFIASASHDLGQPLQAAALFFDQSVRTPEGPGRDAAIDGVRRALAAADQLLSHMLGHLRLEADAVEPHLSNVHLPTLLGRVVEQHRPMAASAGIRLRLAAPDLTLLLDVTLIERALGNLLHNALTHSRGGSVLVAARRHGGGPMRIWVIDDGVGVGRVDAQHIFEDYYQGPVPQSGVRIGFGLGLASVRRLAALMGGSAGIDPRWRRGAAFYLEFPHAEAIPRRSPRKRVARVAA
jgi:signal transduction histidine kinase